MAQQLLSRVIFIFSALLLISSNAVAQNSSALKLRLRAIATGFRSPVHVAFAPGEDDILYVMEQQGNILAVRDGQRVPGKPLLNVSEKIKKGSRRTMLSMVFHPKFVSNGKFYVSFAETDSYGTSFKLSEFVRSPEDGTVDPLEQKEILAIKQDADGYYGGGLTFSREGMLYVGVGDGGSGHDPKGNAQNRKKLLGAVLRLDIDEGDPYIAPLDNPFVLSERGKREIFAYGFRDPWKFSFDRQTGELYLGDRGNAAVEEINIVKSGHNYGWAVYEGGNCLKMRFICANYKSTRPYKTYPHSEGSAITGGFVYRGIRFPEFKGIYFFADAESGRLWGLIKKKGRKPKAKLLGRTKMSISAFAEDNQGELYLVDKKQGAVYALEGVDK